MHLTSSSPKAKRSISFGAKIACGTELHANESGAWNALHGRFIMKRINHQEAHSLNGDA